MANSIFLARLIGPVALAVGIGLFLNAVGFRTMADEVMRSRALVFISGVLSMVAGLAIVLTHNVWTANWPVLITLIGWLALLTGLARILVPDRIEALGRRAVRHPHTFNIGGIVWCAVGALLCFFGYVSH
jgi:uncharacterized membrane protein